MDNMELVELLVCKNDDILIKNVSLSSVANMYSLTIYDYLTLIKYLLKKNIKDAYIIKSMSLFKENSYYMTNTKILVTRNEYEKIKKLIFDFSYTCCSNIGIDKFKKLGLSSSSEIELEEQIFKKTDTYSCFYKKEDKWYQKISDVLIDEEDKQKKYKLIK